MSALDPAFLGPPIAHRALHGPGRPENSLAAVRAAVDAGYGIEIDVQPSSDGVPMVFHDYRLSRMTEADGPVSGRTAAALRTLVLKGGDEGIPTLAEVLDAVHGRVPLLIEIKDQDGAMGPDVGALEASVAALLESYAGPVAVMSFNPHSVAEMARLLPAVPRGITSDAARARDYPGATDDTLALLRAIEYDRVGASFISHDARDLGNPRVAELKASGAAILCWTIRSAAQEAEARRVAQNITFEGYLPPHDAP